MVNKQSSLGSPTPIIKKEGDVVFVDGQGFSVAKELQEDFIEEEIRIRKSRPRSTTTGPSRADIERQRQAELQAQRRLEQSTRLEAQRQAQAEQRQREILTKIRNQQELTNADLVELRRQGIQEGAIKRTEFGVEPLKRFAGEKIRRQEGTETQQQLIGVISGVEQPRGRLERFESGLREKREELKTKELRGKSLSSLESLKLFGTSATLPLVTTLTSFKSLPLFVESIKRDPKGTYERARLQSKQSFLNIPRLAKESPISFTGAVAGEIATSFSPTIATKGVGAVGKLAGFPKYSTTFLARTTSAEGKVSKAVAVTTRKGLTSNTKYLSGIITQMKQIPETNKFISATIGVTRRQEGFLGSRFTKAQKFGVAELGTITQKDINLLIGRKGFELRKPIKDVSIIKSVGAVSGDKPSFFVGTGALLPSREDRFISISRTALLKGKKSKISGVGVSDEIGIVKISPISQTNFISGTGAKTISQKATGKQALKKGIELSIEKQVKTESLVKAKTIGSLSPLTRSITPTTTKSVTTSPTSKQAQDVKLKLAKTTFQGTSQKQSQSQRGALAQISLSSQESKQPTRQKSFPRLKLELAQAQALKQLTKRVLITEQTTDRTTPRTTFRPSRGFLTYLPTPKFRKTMKPSSFYSVFVRRAGVFRPVATTKTLSRALSIGKERTGSTLGATFKVTGKDLKLPTSIPGYYSRSTKQGRLFIERRGRRLSSKSERREIQTAKRRKKK